MLEDCYRDLECLGIAIQEMACNQSHIAVHLCFIQERNTGKSNRKRQHTIDKGSTTVVALRLLLCGKIYFLNIFLKKKDV